MFFENELKNAIQDVKDSFNKEIRIPLLNQRLSKNHGFKTPSFKTNIFGGSCRDVPWYVSTSKNNLCPLPFALLIVVVESQKVSKLNRIITYFL